MGDVAIRRGARAMSYACRLTTWCFYADKRVGRASRLADDRDTGRERVNIPGRRREVIACHHAHRLFFPSLPCCNEADRRPVIFTWDNQDVTSLMAQAPEHHAKHTLTTPRCTLMQVQRNPRGSVSDRTCSCLTIVRPHLTPERRHNLD
jgi:hypothetical protein